ncbi:MAG: isoamylase early set domain-containing protein [Bacteroidota bacterium]
MSISKKSLKSKPVTKVTFKLSKADVEGAQSVQLLGDFNEWDQANGEMKPLKNGSFSATLNLESGKEYQFRYLVDGQSWMNENEADKVTSSPFGSENSVLVL